MGFLCDKEMKILAKFEKVVVGSLCVLVLGRVTR